MTAWRFTPAEWWVLSDVAGVYRYPAPIAAYCTGDVAAARVDLQRKGHLQGPYLHQYLDDAIRALAAPRSWVDVVWMTGGDQLTRLVGAVGGSVGVVAVQDIESTRLVLTDPDDLISDLVKELPPVPAGRTPLVRVARRSASPSEQPEGILVSASSGYSRQEREELSAKEVLDAPHEITGQITANVRTEDGVRRSGTLRWCDNPGDGRYLVSVQREAVSVKPAGADEVQRTTSALLASLS